MQECQLCLSSFSNMSPDLCFTSFFFFGGGGGGWGGGGGGVMKGNSVTFENI